MATPSSARRAALTSAVKAAVKAEPGGEVARAAKVAARCLQAGRITSAARLLQVDRAAQLARAMLERQERQERQRELGLPPAGAVRAVWVASRAKQARVRAAPAGEVQAAKAGRT